MGFYGLFCQLQIHQLFLINHWNYKFRTRPPLCIAIFVGVINSICINQVQTNSPQTKKMLLFVYFYRQLTAVNLKSVRT